MSGGRPYSNERRELTTAMDTKKTDVIVIGGGGSGLAAAIEARSIGREVILIEKNPTLGGSTGRSVGSLSASNTPHQIAKGIKDSPQAHFEDMPLFAKKWSGRPDNAALRRLFTENVPETVRWLMSMGVVFYGPTPEPPHRYPRMHNVLPTSQAYIYFLNRRARRIGVDIHLGTKALEFIVNGGRVEGVICESAQKSKHRFLARGAVVLASGDFTANPELKAKYISPLVAGIEPINPTNTGDGHIMAARLGARVLNGEVVPLYVRFAPPKRKRLIHYIPPWPIFTRPMNWAMQNLPASLLRPAVMSFLTTFLSPSSKLISSGAVLVNKRGERFAADEQDIAPAVAQQEDHSCYIVFDEEVAAKFTRWPNFVSTAPGVGYAYLQDYRRTRKDVYHSAASIVKLAQQLGVSPPALEASLTKDGTKQCKSPFYALGPVKIMLTLCDGGLAVSDQLQVLDAEGNAIPGLYAAGSVGQGGLLLEGHGHHIGWAMTSGRIAGRNAANHVIS